MFKFFTISGVLLLVMLVGIRITNSQNSALPQPEPGPETVAESGEFSVENGVAMDELSSEPRLKVEMREGAITFILEGKRGDVSNKEQFGKISVDLTLMGMPPTTTIAAAEGQAIVQIPRSKILFNGGEGENALGAPAGKVATASQTMIINISKEVYGDSAPSTPPLPPTGAPGQHLAAIAIQTVFSDRKVAVSEPELSASAPDFPVSEPELSASAPDFPDSELEFSASVRDFSAPKPEIFASVQNLPVSAETLEKKNKEVAVLLPKVKKRAANIYDEYGKYIESDVKINYGQWGEGYRSNRREPESKNDRTYLQWQKAQKSWNNPRL